MNFKTFIWSFIIWIFLGWTLTTAQADVVVQWDPYTDNASGIMVCYDTVSHAEEMDPNTIPYAYTNEVSVSSTQLTYPNSTFTGMSVVYFRIYAFKDTFAGGNPARFVSNYSTTEPSLDVILIQRPNPVEGFSATSDTILILE